MKEKASIEQIKQHVVEELDHKLSPLLTYHNTKHTLYVLNSCTEIAVKEGVTSSELKLLQLAALYHDIGFIDTYKNHELKSAEKAAIDLSQFGYNKSEIEVVKKVIMATRRQEEPVDLMGKIICDADVYYLGTSKFSQMASNLYLELKNHKLINAKKDWDEMQIDFLEGHRYYTDYCIKFRAPIKRRNLMMLKANYK